MPRFSCITLAFSNSVAYSSISLSSIANALTVLILLRASSQTAVDLATYTIIQSYRNWL